MLRHPLDEHSELKLLEPRHAPELFELIRRNRDHLREWLPFPDPTRSVEDSQRFIEGRLKALSQGKGLTLGIWHQGRLAGVLSLRLHPLSRRGEIGYWLGEEFQGKGLVTRACRALLDYAFEELKLHRVEIHCASRNARSRAVPERLGFQREAVLREACWTAHGLDDRVIYGLLAREWAARRSLCGKG